MLSPRRAPLAWRPSHIPQSLGSLSLVTYDPFSPRHVTLYHSRRRSGWLVKNTNAPRASTSLSSLSRCVVCCAPALAAFLGALPALGRVGPGLEPEGCIHPLLPLILSRLRNGQGSPLRTSRGQRPRWGSPSQEEGLLPACEPLEAAEPRPRRPRGGRAAPAVRAQMAWPCRPLVSPVT